MNAVFEEVGVVRVRRLLFMIWNVAPRSTPPPRVLVERARCREI